MWAGDAETWVGKKLEATSWRGLEPHRQEGFCILVGRQKEKMKLCFPTSNYVWNRLCVMLREFKVQARSLWEELNKSSLKR